MPDDFHGRLRHRWLAAACCRILACACTCSITGCHSNDGGGQQSSDAEERAVAFLRREVPAWSRENGCFSCHNNGDAARALFAARQQGFRVPKETLADTINWIANPAEWSNNQGDPGFSDQRLADIQFGAALLSASTLPAAEKPAGWIAAARRIAGGQDDDGSWRIEPQNTVGSPATYGTPLATFMAWRVLRRVQAPGTEEAFQSAQRWLSALKPDNTPAAAVMILTAAEQPGVFEDENRRAAFFWLRAAQASDGGWGPYRDTPAEAFDTALALLALSKLRDQPDVHGVIRRGRAFLIAWQRADGSWPASTRPPGGNSYAQQLSTTGWALLALLATGR